MRILVIGGIYKTPYSTLDGGYIIAKLIGEYGDNKVDYYTHLSSNEQALTKRIKEKLSRFRVNMRNTPTVSMDYGSIDDSGIDPGSNGYKLSTSHLALNDYDYIIASTDINESSLKQLLTRAYNANIPCIVFSRGEYDIDDDAPHRSVIDIEGFYYSDSYDIIFETLLDQNIIDKTKRKPLSNYEYILEKLKSLYVLPRIFILAVIVLVMFLSIMFLFEFLSERGDYPTHVDWNAAVDHPDCETVEECAIYGDALIDEIEDHINLLNDPYVFHENRSTVNYITYDIDDDGMPHNPTEHNALPFGEAEDFLEIWDLYANIVPDAHVNDVNRFRLFSDGEGSRVAYVSISPGDTLLAVDIRDNQNRSQLYRTLIHEFAHVYSLPMEDFTCATTALSCLKDDAMLADYIERFWTQYGEDWYDNTHKPMPQREAFYNNNFQDFYIPYQATNVKEDFAVTFVQFVIRPTPIDPVQLKDIKALSLYEYEELVRMRVDMLSNILEIERDSE